MYQIDFHKPLHIHFIGIGGISMSGLAEILLGEDFVISRFRFQIQSSYAGTGEKGSHHLLRTACHKHYR